MRRVLPLAVCALTVALSGQQSTRQSAPSMIDMNGRRVEMPALSVSETAAGGLRTETVRSINGRTVPLQKTEDRVIRSDGQTKVIERTVQRYDQNGNPTNSDLIRIEERKGPDGSGTVQATMYTRDMNGQQQLSERVTTEIKKSGTTQSTTLVERPGTGGLQPYERTVAVERPAGSGAEVQTNTSRRDLNGNMSEFAREIKSTVKSGAAEKVDTTRYEVGPDGKLELASRTIGTTTTAANGSQVEQIDVYSRFSAGRVSDVNSSTPRLQEQIVKERVPGPGNTIIETTSVRARSGTYPSRFNNYEKVSQTTYVTTDAAGREVKSSQTTLTRRDLNGNLVAVEQSNDLSATPKPAAPAPAAAKPAAPAK
ncbi:MAG: hypothetical protein ACRD8O_03945 [Bryobacteraceae bacterium]